MEYEVVIGLEIHAQLLTDSKAFCGCSSRFGAEPNANTCPICLGMPGVLPVLNARALEYTVSMAIACNCTITTVSRFARKNYYYPDLPKNYQISQYELPVAEHGWVDVETESGIHRIGITRIHMEEDAGKLMHDPRKPVSYVDLNRTGVPLIEIVSEPEMSDPAEAAQYLRTLRAILVYLGICDGNMEEGSFRCDANVSLRPKGETRLGVKAEVKNMNSFRNVQRALQYEIERQKAELDAGGRIVQETRLFNPDTGTTASMRSKEQAHDYRYFPDPDLLPLKVDPEMFERVRAALPELPSQKKERFVSAMGIPAYDAGVLTASKPLADYFERAVELFPNPKAVSNWIMTELMRALKSGEDADPTHFPVSPEHLAELLALMHDGTISGRIAKTVFEEMIASGKSAAVVVKEKGLVQVSDESAIRELVCGILDKNPQELVKFLAGKEQVRGWFVGQAMKASKGKANPALLNKVLDEELARRASEQ